MWVQIYPKGHGYLDTSKDLGAETPPSRGCKDTPEAMGIGMPQRCGDAPLDLGTETLKVSC